MPELWDIYDENRVKTGRTVERGQPMAPDEFHIVVNAWLTDGSGQLLISKRTPNKPYPNMWNARAVPRWRVKTASPPRCAK